MNPLLIIGIILLSLVLILGIYFYIWQKKAFNPLETSKIEISSDEITIYAIKERNVNFFFISDGENVVGIDAGYGDITPEYLNSTINADILNIGHIFLTHADFDHVGGLKQFSNAEFYLHEHEFKIATGTVPRLFGFYRYKKSPYHFTLIKDLGQFNLGKIHIQFLSTPGHTSGSCSYLVNDKWLFTGDTLRLKNGIVEPFYRFISMDPISQKKSITKLAKIEGLEMLITSHTKTTQQVDEAFKNWR